MPRPIWSVSFKPQIAYFCRLPAEDQLERLMEHIAPTAPQVPRDPGRQARRHRLHRTAVRQGKHSSATAPMPSRSRPSWVLTPSPYLAAYPSKAFLAVPHLQPRRRRPAKPAPGQHRRPAPDVRVTVPSWPRPLEPERPAGSGGGATYLQRLRRVQHCAHAALAHPRRGRAGRRCSGGHRARRPAQRRAHHRELVACRAVRLRVMTLARPPRVEALRTAVLEAAQRLSALPNRPSPAAPIVPPRSPAHATEMAGGLRGAGAGAQLHLRSRAAPCHPPAFGRHVRALESGRARR